MYPTSSWLPITASSTDPEVRNVSPDQANLTLHLEEVRDCRWEAGHDFPWATASPEHLALLANRRVRAQRPRDDWQKAVSWKGPLDAQAPRVAPLRALLVLQPVPDGELA